MRELLDLLGKVPKPPEESEPGGATAGQLARLEEGLGFPIPGQLREWLSVHNGSHAGPGGLYGIGTPSESLDILWNLGLRPGWRERRWIPVAGDGNGNDYVVDASRSHLVSDAVYFVDVTEDPDSFAYVVASDVVTFLRFLLQKELGGTEWPFSQNHVLAVDPELAEITRTSLLPWLPPGL